MLEKQGRIDQSVGAPLFWRFLHRAEMPMTPLSGSG